MISPEAILKHLSKRLPDFEAAGMPEPLQGGYLNYVWRVPGAPNSAWQSVIIKHAPSHIALMPEIPLDSGRILIEANALTAFGPQGCALLLLLLRCALPIYSIWMPVNIF